MSLFQELAADARLSTKDAAQFLGYRPRTLREWRRLGIGPRHSALSTKHVVYAIEDLRTWRAEREACMAQGVGARTRGEG